MQKGFVQILVLVAIVAVAILFTPIPYYVSRDKIVCLGVGICPRHGWNLGPSLWQRISGGTYSFSEQNPVVWPSVQPGFSGKPTPDTLPGDTKSSVTEDEKQKIDAWIAENNLNQYGDSRDTVYMGGTPLFDERTGKGIDRYEYIIQKHPEKPWNK